MGRSRHLVLRRFASVVAAGLGLSCALAAPAAAAPDTERFDARCDVLGDLELTMGPGQGVWTPAFVVGSNQRLLPYAFDIRFGDVEIQVAKKAPKHGRLDRCEFEQGFGGASGTVWVSYTPR